MTFYRYMMNFDKEDTQRGYFARDIKSDGNFPKKAREYNTLAEYFYKSFDRYDPDEITENFNYCYDMYDQYEFSRKGGVMPIK